MFVLAPLVARQFEAVAVKHYTLQGSALRYERVSSKNSSSLLCELRNEENVDCIKEATMTLKLVFSGITISQALYHQGNNWLLNSTQVAHNHI